MRLFLARIRDFIMAIVRFLTKDIWSLDFSQLSNARKRWIRSAQALIEAHGGKNAGSVSGKTTWLLAGEKAGPEKLKKAEKLGIPVISESDFRQLIESE